MKETTWADVAPGDVIRLKGLRWTVSDHRPDGLITLTGDGGMSHTGKPNRTDRVELLERPEAEPETEQAAVEVIQHKTNATVLGTKEKGKPWRVPKLIQDLGTFRTHLFMLHGTWAGDLKTRKQIEAVHRQSHEDAIAGIPLPTYQEHEHV